jgi:predicted lipid-binding transport protein (Tim44 family)
LATYFGLQQAVATCDASIGTFGVTVEIVILAMIAAFLGLRLYSVLGRRAEHEEEPIPGRIDPQPKAAPSVNGAPLQPAERSQPTPRVQDAPQFAPQVERGLRAIAAADRRFDAYSFVEGAKGAYRMVLEAFWRGDKAELRDLCDADVLAAFSAAIDAREAAGETLDNRLVRIEEVTIVAADYAAPKARITLQFRSDIAAVTRNAESQVVAGSLNDAVEAIDVWTFSRDVNSPDPDWLLDEADEG